MGLLEIYHRSSLFDEVMEELEYRFRKILKLDESSHIFFLPGGASFLFAAIPLNFLKKDQAAGFLHSGYWTDKAIAETKRIGEARLLASSEADQFLCLPTLPTATDTKDVCYIQYCSNNTIEGTQWHSLPRFENTPVVVDMSSDILSRELDFNQFDLIFGGLQKNLGAAGIAVCVIRDSFLQSSNKGLPIFFQLSAHLTAGSRLNTPHTLGLYLCLLMLRWLEDQGGLIAIGEENRRKAEFLYEYLDQSSVFEAPVREADRSHMNIVFDLKPEHKEQEERFLSEAEDGGFLSLAGHRSRGGFRASLYNAQSFDSVRALTLFMEKFESKIKA